MADSVMVCVDDFERYAVGHLPKNALDYYRSGADDEVTLRRNVEAFKRLIIRPRFLRDISQRDLSCTLLNGTVRMSFPIGIAPTASQRMAHPEGECATAKAAAQLGTVMTVSTIATCSLEEVADAGGHQSPRFFQLYVYKDKAETIALVRRVEKAGYKALVVTVDAQYSGKRRADLRNGYSLPPHLRMANFPQSDVKSSAMVATKSGTSGFGEYMTRLMDQTLSWEHIDWLRTITKLPIILKGILTAEDATEALSHGVAAIVVSNHGARQLDSSPAAIEALPEIVAAVGDRMDVYMDGGIRTGNDVFKSLALGAKAVFVGRPVLWGLAHSGQHGVEKVLSILRDEFDLTLALAAVVGISVGQIGCESPVVSLETTENGEDMQEFHQFLAKPTRDQIQTGSQSSTAALLETYRSGRGATLNDSKVPLEHFGQNSTPFVAVSGLFSSAPVSSVLTTTASCRRSELSAGDSLQLLKGSDQQGFPIDYFSSAGPHNDYDSTAVYAVLRSQPADSGAASAAERLLRQNLQSVGGGRNDRLHPLSTVRPTISPALLCAIQQVTEEERLKTDQQRLTVSHNQQSQSNLPPLPQLDSLVSSIGLTSNSPVVTPLETHVDLSGNRLGRSGRQSPVSSYDDSPTLEDIGGANEDSSDDLYGRVIKDYANGANEILKPGVNGRKRRRSSSSNSGFGDGTTPLGRQQHSCETCGKSFQNNSALIKHKLIHSDERKFVCLQCSKGFKRLDHLNGHLNVHKSVKPFQCVITGCDKSYCDARSLRRHLEHAHNMHNPVVHSSRGIINVRCEGVNYSRAMNSTSHVGESSSRRPTSQLSSNSAESGGNSVRSHNNSSSAAVASGELESGAENSESDSSPPDHWKKKSQKDCVKPKSLPTAQPVTCGQCNRVFKNVPALNGHMRLHSQQGKKGHPGKPESNANGSSPQFSSPTGSCASASDSRVLSPPGPNCPTSGMGTFCPAIATEQQNQQQHDQMDYGNYVGSAPNAEPPNIMNPLPITRVVGHYADFHPTPLENDLINSFTECYSPAPVAQHHLSAPEPLTIEPLDHNNVMAAGQDPMIHSAPASFYYNESSNYSADPDHFTLGGFIDKPRYSMTDGHCVVQQDQQQNSVGLQQTLYVETYQDQSDSKCQMSDQMQNHQDPMNNSHFSHPSNNMAIVPFDTGMNPFAYGIVANGGQNHIDPVIHPANRNLLMSVEPVNEGILSTQMVHGGTDVHSNCMAMSHGHVNGGGQQLLSGMNLLGQHQQTHMGIGDSMSNMDHYANTGGMMNQPNQFGQVGGNIFTDLDESMMNATSDLGSSEYNQANSMSEFDDDLNDRELASLFQISLNYGMFETPQSCAPGTSSQYYQYGSSYAEQNAEKGESLRKRHFTAPGAISMSKFHTTGKPLKPLSPKTKKRHKCLPGSSLFHQQAGGNGVGGGAQQSRTSACTRDVRRSQQQYVEKKFFNLPVSPVRFKKRSNRPTPLLLPGAATLNRFCSQLRSPKCWEYPQSGSKIPPYTPPPILSPMRLGSGLFWKLGRLAHCYLVGPRSAPIAQKFSNPFNSSSPITQASRKENSLLPPGDQELLEVLTDPTAENDGLIETSSRPHINVGEEFQAVIPEYSDRSYYPSDYDAGDLCVFKPETLQQSSEDSIRNFLDFGCTAGVYGGGRNLELALNLLHFCNGEVQEAVSQLIHLHANQDAQQLVPYGYVDTEIWTQEEIVRFSESLQKFDKDFYAVAHEIPTKTVKMCVSFYYFWKKVCQDEYKRLRTLRRKREMADHMGVYNLRSSNSAVTIVTEELPEEPTAQLSRMHLSNSGSGRDYSTDNAGTGDRGMGGVEKSRVTFNEVLQSDFPCKVCGKVFEKTKSRNAHMRSHSAKGVQ